MMVLYNTRCATNRTLNHLIAIGLQEFIWGGHFLGAEHLPQNGPAVFVCNHQKAMGPIAAGAGVPLPMHFWIHGEMLDPARAANYLRRDFVEPQLHIPAPLSRTVATALSKVTVPLLGAVGGIAVHKEGGRLLETYQTSVDLLEAGGYLLIFPEDPDQAPDPRTQMTPFKKGFARLGELYYQRTHRLLEFYPLMVHAGRRIVRLERPLQFNPMSPPLSERARIKQVLEKTIRGLYLDAEANDAVFMPLTN